MQLQNEQIRSQNRAAALSINAVIIDGVAIGTDLLFGKVADINTSYAMIIGVLSD